MNKIGLGFIGYGTVGSGVGEILSDNVELLQKRTNGLFKFTIEKVAVQNTSKKRKSISQQIITDSWQEVIEDPAVHIVIELMGGTSTAFNVVEAALKSKKPVITGNKALLAEYGKELFSLSQEMQTPIYFEASVAGAIPVIKTLKESFIGNNIQSISGIINGTSNYILERMSSENLSYIEALAEAQELGYAESDPTLDVNGWDAAHKAAIIALVCFGSTIDTEELAVSGIEQVRTLDIEFAERLGYQIKLLSRIISKENCSLEIRTQPSFIPKSKLLSQVKGVFNAISIKADKIGESILYGQGAGKEPTASSVVSDLIDAANYLAFQVPNYFLPYSSDISCIKAVETETPYYVRFSVIDQPGVIAEISSILAEQKIGISGTHSLIDPENPNQEFKDIIFLLHSCPLGQLNDALDLCSKLQSICEYPVVFRIEDNC